MQFVVYTAHRDSVLIGLEADPKLMCEHLNSSELQPNIAKRTFRRMFLITMQVSVQLLALHYGGGEKGVVLY